MLPDLVSDKISLKPVKIVRENGDVEEVYIQDTSNNKAAALHYKLTIAYLAVGIIALTFTIYLQIKKD